MVKLLNPFVDATIRSMLKSTYDANPFSALSIFQKLTPDKVMETGMRAEDGKPLERPLGSPNMLSPWNKFFFNSRQLFSLPTESLSLVNTETIIGPNCKKPLHLSMPILITAMSLGGSLSVGIKQALAKGSSRVGTSTNTGESNVTPEERGHAKLLFGQINRAMRLDENRLKVVDAIEIQFGQGAWGGAAEINDKVVDDYLAEIWNTPQGSYSTVRPRYPGINSPEEIVRFINSIKRKYDVPVGVKLAGSDFIEYDLEVIAKTDADFITIDGSEGGTSGAPTTLEDDVGLPTFYSLVRAATWLEKKGIKDRFQIILTGGLRTPGEFLKAIALGADAVAIGSIALIATLQDQITKALPELPPTQVATYTGKRSQDFDVEKGAENLANFLNSCNEEIKYAIQVMGKRHVSDLNKEDLVSVDKQLADFAQTRYAGTHRV